MANIGKWKRDCICYHPTENIEVIIMIDITVLKLGRQVKIVWFYKTHPCLKVHQDLQIYQPQFTGRCDHSC